MKTVVSTQLNVRDIMLTQADRRVLEAIQTRNLQQFRGWTAQMETDVIRAVSDGVAAGESIDKISGRISDAINTSNTRARRIARTESINAAVEGARSRYRDYGIEYVEIIACDDWRTCKICQQHDGKVYSVDDDAHMPPYHPNCRCAIKAVVKKRNEKEELEKLKRRAETEVPKIEQVKYATRIEAVDAYVPLKTKEETARFAREQGVKIVSYDTASIDLANNWNQAILSLPEDIRQYTIISSDELNKMLFGRLPPSEKYGGVTVTIGDRIMTAYSSSYTNLEILESTKLRNNERYFQKYGHTWHFNTKGTSTAFHECGHVYAKVRGLPKGFAEDAKKWAIESECDMLEDINEAWAEAWAAYYIRNEKLPEYIAKYIREAK